jgi:predicted dehydrogenase
MVGFVEPVEANRRASQEQFGLPEGQVFRSLAEAVGVVQADFAVDTTPPAAHEAVATEALKAGLHVIEEKPMSDDFAAARRIVKTAAENGRTYMITQNYRFGPQPRTARALLASGRVGAPAVVEMGFYRAWATRAGTHYTTMAFPLLKDMGIHHFDLLRYVLGLEPERVQAVTWNPPWGWHAGDAAHNVTIHFAGGCIASHHGCGCSVGRQTGWNGDLRVEGANGSLTWDEGGIELSSHRLGEASAQEKVEPLEVPLMGPDACLAEFIAALKEGREPECSGRDNLQSLAIVFAAVRSAETGRPVAIEELFEGGRQVWEKIA